jgi:hypothetical protein
VNELPPASIATMLHAVIERLGTSVPITTQTPPNTDPPTATASGIGEGQHLHGAGEEQDAVHEHVDICCNDASATQARSRTEEDDGATSSNCGGGAVESAIMQSASIETLCNPTSPLAATVRPSDWHQGAIVPEEVVVQRV